MLALESTGQTSAGTSLEELGELLSKNIIFYKEPGSETNYVTVDGTYRVET